MGRAHISDIESGVGFLGGFLSTLMGFVRERGVPFEAIHRLGKERGRGTIKKIVELAYADWLAELSDNVYVTYAPMPFFAALQQEFGKDNISVNFDGRPWKLHRSCVDMDRTPGKRRFYLHSVGRDWTGEERIVWGLAQRSADAPNGYRPATEQETYEFTKAHPELADFVGLGSSTVGDDGYECVAYVWSKEGRRVFGTSWIGRVFEARDQVLFVSR